MNQTLSAGLIRYFSLLSVLISLLFIPPALVFSGDIKKPGELSPEIFKKAEEAAKSFRSSMGPEHFEGIVERTKREALNKIGYEKRAQRESCGDPDPIYYFVSFSMPEEVLLEIMREGAHLNKRCRERIVFVLRGFVKNNLKQTALAFYRLQRKIEDDAFIEVDPELFEKFSISRVPFAVREVSSSIGRIGGDRSGPGYVVRRFREELKDYGIYGKTYPISEQNILDLISSKQKQKEVENKLRERLPEIRRRMLVLNRFDGKFEHAKKDEVYYINPRVVLKDDIVDHEGNVVIPKGTVFDPTKRVKLGRYIIIDGNSPKQVRFALRGDYRKIILISGDLGKLVKEHKRSFYFATEDLIRKFKVRRVPAIIEGDGDYVKVTEKAI